MSFAEWKKKSKLFKELKDRAVRHGIPYEEACQAAYKAGQRDSKPMQVEVDFSNKTINQFLQGR